MSELVINDSMEQLSEENNRLSNDLQYLQKCVVFLENYRKYLINFNNNCVCNQKSLQLNANDIIIDSLEKQYKIVFREENQLRHEIKDRKSDKNDIQLNTSLAIDKKLVFDYKSNQLFSNRNTNKPIERSVTTENTKKQIIVKRVINISESKDIYNLINNKDLEIELIDRQSDDSIDGSVDGLIDGLDLIENEIKAKDNVRSNANNRRNNEIRLLFKKTNDSLKQKYIEKRLNEKQRKSGQKSVKKRRPMPLKKYRCDWRGCRHKTAKQIDLLAHIRQIHTNEFPFQCSECDKCFTIEKLLVFHKQKIHKIFEKKKIKRERIRLKRNACDWLGCDYRSDNKMHLLAHTRRMHTNERPFECSECQKCFTVEYLLNDHQLKMHSNSGNKYRCDYTDCQYETKHRGNLTQHWIIHKNVRNFKCDESGCDKSFVRKDTLKKHKKFVHCTDRPYGCDWPGCDTTYKTSQTLKDHKLNHMNERQFGCDYNDCQKRFNCSKRLAMHKREHLKPYLCHWPDCEQRFGSKRSLTAHMNRHQNLKPFNCHFSGCAKSFCIKPHLNQHLRVVHKYRES